MRFAFLVRDPDDRTKYAGNSLEWAPPVRVIAVVTLFAATLDLMADLLVCNRIAEFLDNFQSQIAIYAAYGTLKYDEEDVFYARLAKSMVLTLEEVRHFIDSL
ncbi:hypothetical protein WR25_10848 [Diploscapter pachys]|uniref:Uncharacterized protein n=1 Tax=Diploscapter pachys TaxID=2018661 RepID=A0A2A2LBF8_9BILA|nr:hypothetical protein WR25_10848 [Diploscapter pachys]